MELLTEGGTNDGCGIAISQRAETQDEEDKDVVQVDLLLVQYSQFLFGRHDVKRLGECLPGVARCR